MPGIYRPPNAKPTTPGDGDALRGYAARLRNAAKRLQAISDDADSQVYFYSFDWDGQWKDDFLTTWGVNITGNDQLSARARSDANAAAYAAYQKDRADFLKAHPGQARLYDANVQPAQAPDQTVFRVAIDACNGMADYLEKYAHTVDQEIAQEEKFIFDAVVIVLSIAATVATLGALGPEAGILDVVLVGADIGGLTAGTIDYGNQTIDNLTVNHDGWSSFVDINTQELGASILTGMIIGGVSSFAGAGLAQVFKGAPAAVRIVASALGFGGGTFAGDATSQFLFNKDHSVDWGKAGVDALIAAGFAGIAGAVFHPTTAQPAGAGDPTASPDFSPTMTVTKGSDTYVVAFNGDGTMPVVKNLDPLGNASFDGNTLVINNGEVRVPLADSNVMVTNGVSHVDVTIGADGTPTVNSVRVISDGAQTVQFANGDTATVPKGTSITYLSGADGAPELLVRPPDVTTSTPPVGGDLTTGQPAPVTTADPSSGTAPELPGKTPDLSVPTPTSSPTEVPPVTGAPREVITVGKVGDAYLATQNQTPLGQAQVVDGAVQVNGKTYSLAGMDVPEGGRLARITITEGGDGQQIVTLRVVSNGDMVVGDTKVPNGWVAEIGSDGLRVMINPSSGDISGIDGFPRSGAGMTTPPAPPETGPSLGGTSTTEAPPLAPNGEGFKAPWGWKVTGQGADTTVTTASGRTFSENLPAEPQAPGGPGGVTPEVPAAAAQGDEGFKAPWGWKVTGQGADTTVTTASGRTFSEKLPAEPQSPGGPGGVTPEPGGGTGTTTPENGSGSWNPSPFKPDQPGSGVAPQTETRPQGAVATIVEDPPAETSTGALSPTEQVPMDGPLSSVTIDDVLSGRVFQAPGAVTDPNAGSLPGSAGAEPTSATASPPEAPGSTVPPSSDTNASSGSSPSGPPETATPTTPAASTEPAPLETPPAAPARTPGTGGLSGPSLGGLATGASGASRTDIGRTLQDDPAAVQRILTRELNKIVRMGIADASATAAPMAALGPFSTPPPPPSEVPGPITWLPKPPPTEVPVVQPPVVPVPRDPQVTPPGTWLPKPPPVEVPGPFPSPRPVPAPPPPSSTPGPGQPFPTPGPSPLPTPGPFPTPGPGPFPTPGPSPLPTPGPGPQPMPGPSPQPTPGTWPAPAPKPVPGAPPQSAPGQRPQPTPGQPPLPIPGTPPGVFPPPEFTPPPPFKEPPLPLEIPLKRPTEFPSHDRAPDMTDPETWVPKIPYELPLRPQPRPDQPPRIVVDPSLPGQARERPSWVPDIRASAGPGPSASGEGENTPEPVPTAAPAVEPGEVEQPEETGLGPGGNGPFPEFSTEELLGRMKVVGPIVRISADPSGAPALLLEIGAGPANTDLGMPPEPGQGDLAVNDPSLVDVTHSDIRVRPGVVYLNADEPIPEELRGRFNTVIVNNPHGYEVDIARLGEALRPGGHLIVQGRAEITRGMRPANPVMTRLLRSVGAGHVPAGYRLVDVVTDETVPGGQRGDPAVVGKPSWVLGGPFHQTSGGSVSWPNTRIVIARLPAPAAGTGTPPVPAPEEPPAAEQTPERERPKGPGKGRTPGQAPRQGGRRAKAPARLEARDPGELLESKAVQTSEYLLGAESVVSSIEIERRPLSHGGFDPTTGKLGLAQRHMAALSRAFYSHMAGQELTDEELGELVDAVTTLWHELIHGIYPPGAPHRPDPTVLGGNPVPAGLDPYSKDHAKNLEEGLTEWEAQATLADFAEASGILRMAGLTRERFLSGVMSDDPYAARVELVRAFAEQGGAELLGFDDVAAYRSAQAVQNSMTRAGWMADRIIDAQQLPSTPEARQRLIDAIARAFDAPLPNGSTVEEGTALAGRALPALRAEVEQIRAGAAAPTPAEEPEVGPGGQERQRPAGRAESSKEAVEYEQRASGLWVPAPDTRPLWTPWSEQQPLWTAAQEQQPLWLPGQAAAHAPQQTSQSPSPAVQAQPTGTVRPPRPFFQTVTPPPAAQPGPQVPAAPSAGGDDVLEAFRGTGMRRFEARLTRTHSIRRIPTPPPGQGELPIALRALAPLVGGEHAIWAMLGMYFNTVERLPKPVARMLDWPRALLSSPLRGVLNGTTWNHAHDAAIGLYRTPSGAWYLAVGSKNYRRSTSTGPTNTQRPGVTIPIAPHAPFGPEVIPLGPGVELRSGPVRVSGPAYLLTGEGHTVKLDGKAKLLALKVSGPGPRIVRANVEGVETREDTNGTGVGAAPLIGWSYNLFVHGVPVPFLYAYSKPVLVVTTTADHHAGPDDLAGNLRALVDPRARDGVHTDAEVRLVELAAGLFFTPNLVRLLRFYVPELNSLELVAPGFLEFVERTIDRVPFLNWNFNPEIATVLGTSFRVHNPFRRKHPALPEAPQVPPLPQAGPGRRPSPKGPRTGTPMAIAGATGSPAPEPQRPAPPQPAPAPAPVWKPGPAEAEVAGRTPARPATRWQTLHPSSDMVMRAEFEGGQTGVFKPDVGRAANEVAAYRTDAELGFGLVPTTVPKAFPPYGEGSLQDWSDGVAALPVQRYTDPDQQRMAVLDYTIANGDRKPLNYLTGRDGRPVAIDHGEAFPGPNPLLPIRSPFVAEWFDRPLAEEVLAQVRGVDPEHFQRMLQATGVSEAAAERAAARLREIQVQGRITGEEWPGFIHGVNRPRPATGSGPAASNGGQAGGSGVILPNGKPLKFLAPDTGAAAGLGFAAPAPAVVRATGDLAPAAAVVEELLRKASGSSLLDQVRNADQALRDVEAGGSPEPAERALAELESAIDAAERDAQLLRLAGERLRNEVDLARALPPMQRPAELPAAEALLAGTVPEAVEAVLESARAVLGAGRLRLNASPAPAVTHAAPAAAAQRPVWMPWSEQQPPVLLPSPGRLRLTPLAPVPPGQGPAPKGPGTARPPVAMAGTTGSPAPEPQPPAEPQPAPAQPVLWKPGGAETRLAGRTPAVPPKQFKRLPGDHSNDGYIVPFEDGDQAVFKPETGVSRLGRQEWRDGELWRQVWGDEWEKVPSDDLRGPREVAAFRTDEMLGFGLVPTTTEASFDPWGAGSLQEWSDGTGSQDAARYGVQDQQRMAVLDYVIANSDRGPGNFLTGPDGRPVAIDNGDSFPPSDTDQRLSSEFVERWLGRELDPEVLAQVRAVDVDEFLAQLRASGLGEAAAERAAARLSEIQRLGRITGEQWDGAIIGRYGVIRGRR